MKEGGKVLPFIDGTTAEDIMSAVQILSERFAEYMETAPALVGTGAHSDDE